MEKIEINRTMAKVGPNSIDRFKDEIAKRGIYRPNRFRIDINKHPVGFHTDDLFLFASSAEIPGVQLSTTEVKQNPQTHLIPYGRIYTSMDIDFLVDSKFQYRQFFDEWMNLVVNRRTLEVGWYDDFVGEIRVNPLGISDDAQWGENYLYPIVLIDAFPITVAAIKVSHDNNNKAATMQVTFAYRKWLPLNDVTGTNPVRYGGRLEGGAFRSNGEGAFIKDQKQPQPPPVVDSFNQFDRLETTRPGS